jgi:hypothetical protein
MSAYQDSIQAFIQILESSSNLISLPDWEELQQLSHSLPESDHEEISAILENWLKTESRSQILAVYQQNLKSIITKSPIDVGENIGIARSQSPTAPNQSSQSSKELVDNAIKNNSPLSDKQKSQPKTN